MSDGRPHGCLHTWDISTRPTYTAPPHAYRCLQHAIRNHIQKGRKASGSRAPQKEIPYVRRARRSPALCSEGHQGRPSMNSPPSPQIRSPRIRCSEEVLQPRAELGQQRRGGAHHVEDEAKQLRQQAQQRADEGDELPQHAHHELGLSWGGGG